MTSQHLDNLVQEYLDAFWQPREKSWKEKIYKYFPKYNPEYVDLIARTRKNRNVVKKLDETINSDEDEKTIVAIAKKQNLSYRSGLALGYLFPEVELPSTETEFDKGLKTGQVYALKEDTIPAQKNIVRGIALMSIAYLMSTRSFIEVNSPEKIELLQNAHKGLTYMAMGCGMYGMYAMLRNKLFMNDAHLSDKLITSGPFTVHRNPFYTGLMAGLGLIASKMLVNNAVAENPDWIATGVVAAGFALMTKGFLDYTILDEQILEKQFGDEYREYKKTTPRFFPKISNLLRKKK